MFPWRQERNERIGLSWMMREKESLKKMTLRLGDREDGAEQAVQADPSGVRRRTMGGGACTEDYLQSALGGKQRSKRGQYL